MDRSTFPIRACHADLERQGNAMLTWPSPRSLLTAFSVYLAVILALAGSPRLRIFQVAVAEPRSAQRVAGRSDRRRRSAGRGLADFHMDHAGAG